MAALGLIVQNGMFSAGTDCLESKLNVDDLPMFAIPTNPIEICEEGLNSWWMNEVINQFNFW